MTSIAAAQELPAPLDLPAPDPLPETPGGEWDLALTDTVAEGAPVIYECTRRAGPDESFLLVGTGLTDRLAVFGRDETGRGERWDAVVQVATDSYLIATLPERAYDGVFLAWVGNDAGWSRPVRLNGPEAWWAGRAEAGSPLALHGRNLTLLNDGTAATVCLSRGDQTRWLDGWTSSPGRVSLWLPRDLEPGLWQVRVHAGWGGRYAWSEPLTVDVAVRDESGAAPAPAASPAPGPGLQAVIDQVAADGGGVVELADGTYPFTGTLRIPAGVRLRGRFAGSTRLALQPSDPQDFAVLPGGGWNQGPGRIHTPGDELEYRVNVPQAGRYHVWLRYATDMSPWNQPGVSGKMSLRAGDAAPVVLEHLENTGGFGTFRWSHSADLDLPAGPINLTWRNDGGGGINLDAYVLTPDDDDTPADAPWPVSSDRRIVLQGEDVLRFATREGELPGRLAAAVWLQGDGAELCGVTVAGTPRVTEGIVVRSTRPNTWVRDCAVVACVVEGVEGTSAENIGVHLVFAEGARVEGNHLTARAPIFLSGARRCEITLNELYPVTRYGGNAEAAILGRTEPLEECVIEDNEIGSPPGAEAGGPTTRRLLWFSTGRGSISHNRIAGNGVTGESPARFGGVAGTDQNVGEMILFEGNHRTMYFGPLAGAEASSITLPETLPDTPDERLGSVTREQLAQDAQGRETPFWPPDAFDDSPEPPIGEYYVTVMRGVGWGQTRRVARREGTRLILTAPWRVPPEAGSVVTVGTAFYQNQILGNECPDGMTGIQLWIACIENDIAGNTIRRQRRPGFYLYSNGTTLASSMPRTWNRGISPLFWNTVTGNRVEECQAGALVTSGDDAALPIEFPRALGNVLRHNSFVRNRTDGVVLTSRKGDAAAGDTAPSIRGTIVEFCLVRDARTAYHAGWGSDGTLFRRNHAYFWYPVSQATEPAVGFRCDVPGATMILGDNNVEGISGEENPAGVEREVRP